MSSDNRAARRRLERAHQRQPVIIAGDHIVAADLGQRYEAKPSAKLVPKVPGQHRWIATGAWVLSDEAVAGMDDAGTIKLLDHENLLYIGVGCWDCEQPFGACAPRCPAAGS